MTTRILRAAAAATLLGLGATTVLAGGWATIVADDATPPEPRRRGRRVRLHGPPARRDAGRLRGSTLRLTNTITGETFDVPAEPSGPARYFVAQFRVPERGQLELWRPAAATGRRDATRHRDGARGRRIGSGCGDDAAADTCVRSCSRGSIGSNATSVGSRSRPPPCGPRFARTQERDELASGATASTPARSPCSAW